MDVFIHWAGFVGAWLLVAGPLFQGARELREESFDRDSFDSAAVEAVPQPPRISAWWWLLPPVAYIKNRKRNQAHRNAVFATLGMQQREQFIGFMNKATGWFMVAGGASLIALKETWELAELYHLPVWLYWIAIVVLSAAAVLNTVRGLIIADRMVHVDDPEYRTRTRPRASAQGRDTSA